MARPWRFGLLRRAVTTLLVEALLHHCIYVGRPGHREDSVLRCPNDSLMGRFRSETVWRKALQRQSPLRFGHIFRIQGDISRHLLSELQICRTEVEKGIDQFFHRFLYFVWGFSTYFAVVVDAYERWKKMT